MLSDRNHLSHTVTATTGRDLKPISETHTAFVFCLLFGSPWRRVPASPVALQAGASQKVLEPHRVWIHSLHSRPVVPQVPYWSGRVSFSEGAGKVARASKQNYPQTISLQGMAFVSMLGKPWKLLAASLHPWMNGEKRKSSRELSSWSPQPVTQTLQTPFLASC